MSKNSRKQTIFKRIKILLLMIALFVGAFSGVVGVFFLPKSKNVSSDFNRIASVKALSASNSKALPILPPGTTPEYIYHFTTINGSNNGKLVPDAIGLSNLQANAWLTKYFNNLEYYGVVDPTASTPLSREYTTAYTTMVKANEATNSESLLQLARTLSDNFTNITKVFQNYTSFNQFKQVQPVGNKLSIIAPKQIRDIFSLQVGNPSQSSSFVHTGLVQNNFAYKVAEINLSTLKDQKSLVFDFKNNAQSDVAKHEYKLVISNEQQEISNFLAMSNPSVVDLVNSRTIFFRDVSGDIDTIAPSPSLASNSAQNKIDNIIKLSYDATTKKLNIFIAPEAANDKSFPIEFEYNQTLSSQGSASSIAAFGIIDDTHSPLHTRKMESVLDPNPSTNDWKYPFFSNPIDIARELIPTNTNMVVSSIPVFSSFGNWDNRIQTIPNVSEANHIRFFMMQNAKFEQDILFNGQDKVAFEAGFNTLTIEHKSNNVVEILPNNFVIKDSAFGLVSSTLNLDEPFNLYYKVLNETLNSIAYPFAQIDLALVSKMVNFNPIIGDPNFNEQVYELKNIASRIFFENPYNSQSVTDYVNQSTQKQVRIESRSDALEKDSEILGDIFRNWSGLETKPTIANTSKTYIEGNTQIFGPNAIQPALPGTIDGFATFGEELNALFPNDDFALKYKQYALATSGRVVDLGMQVGLYKLDSSFNFVLDQNGSKQAIQTTGKDVVEKLISISNTFSYWSINKFNLNKNDFNIGELDEFRLVRATDSIGFVKTKIIDNAGQKGQELKKYANALVNAWLGRVLSAEEQTNYNAIKTTFANKVSPNFWNLVESQGKPDPANPNLESTVEYLESRQKVYYILQYYMVRAINEVINNEVIKFENNKTATLSETFNNYLQRKDLKSIKVKDDLIELVASNKYPSLDLMGQVSHGSIDALNGEEEFGSLIEYIYVLGLQDRFLTGADITTFNDFVENGHIYDPDLFDRNNLQLLTRFMRVVSIVLDNMGAIYNRNHNSNDQIVSLNEMIEKISNGSNSSSSSRALSYGEYGSDPDVPIRELSSIVKKTIGLLTDNVSYASENYVFVGVESKVSFLQSVIIANNVREILQQYVQLNSGKVAKEKIDAIQNYINSKKYYDKNEITNFALNVGYYNIDEFIRQFTNQGQTLLPAVDRILNDLNLDVSKDNLINANSDVFKAISNPNTIVKYTFVSLGAIVGLIGFMMFALSFRAALIGTTTKTIALERMILLVVGLFGIILFIVGLVPGVF